MGLPQWLSGQESTCIAGDVERRVRSRSQEDPLEEEMETHFSNLAQKNPMDRGA